MTASATSQSLTDPYGILAALRAGQPGYVPEWPFPTTGAGAALAAVVADFLVTILRRLDNAPVKAQLGLFDMLGIQLTPAQQAQAVVVFTMTAGATDAQLANNSRLTATGGPTGQIVFETEQALGLAGAQLKQVASFWPDRDAWIDHTAAFTAGQSFTIFNVPDLQDVTHALYLAHDTLLALSGQTTIQLTFDLATPGNTLLPIDWQYWDGTLWRDFQSNNPACQAASQPPDSTNGLQKRGRIILTAGCADSVPVAVNGITSQWIRGLLSSSLVPVSSRILPTVRSIKLGIQFARPLVFRAGPATGTLSGGMEILQVNVQTLGGVALPGFEVSWTGPNDSMGSSSTTDSMGTATFCMDSLLNATTIGSPSVTVNLADVNGSTSVSLTQASTTYAVTFKADGLPADNAFADELALDLTKTFYPFGLVPQAGDAFYIMNEEVLSKPGATVQVLVVKGQTAQDQSFAAALSSPGATIKALQHGVVWEYWNGTAWVELAVNIVIIGPDAITGAKLNPLTTELDLDNTALATFTVPDDLETTAVNNVTGHWMRARLASGAFGLYGAFGPAQMGGLTIPFVMTRAPALADLRLGYTWLEGPVPPEHSVTANDFQYVDQTNAVLWGGPQFSPFQTTTDTTPALYLGFDKPLMPDNDLGIYFEIEEDPTDMPGPPLVWEYWDGLNWQALDSVTDQTAYLRLSGIVSFVGPTDSQPLARFGTSLYWVRARLKDDGPPGTPVFDGLFLNAVTVYQRQTITNESMGTSTGLPNQVFYFQQAPVLGDDWIDVCEVAGAAANVEWAVLAEQVGGSATVAALTAALAAEGSQTDIIVKDVHLVRDSTKTVIQVWIHWYRQPTLYSSGPNDRVYTVDAARGWLIFGGNGLGMIPPAGAAIRATTYMTGGGLAGNVAAGAINQLQGAVGGLQKVSNPQPASGGTDGQTVASYVSQAPGVLQNRGRGLTLSDYENLAYEASPGVAAAYAQATLDTDGNQTPGWVTLLLLPTGGDPLPTPSYGLCQDVLNYIGLRAPADVVAAQQLNIAGPQYQLIDITAAIVPQDPTQAGPVADSVLTALQTFLNPVLGGPNGQGWQPNRSVYLSDVAVVLAGVTGVDYVDQLALLFNGSPVGEQVTVTGGRIAAAGNLQVKIL